MDLPEKLPDNTVALIRLPIPIRQITALCAMFPGPEMHIHQDGGWMVVTKEGGQP